MGWPPKVGELLPCAGDAEGVSEKLAAYSLNIDHDWGGPKARGFAAILAITLDSLDYLEAEILARVLGAPISVVRANPPFGFTCAVDISVRGIGKHSGRVATVRTAWLLSAVNTAPRLTSAYVKP